MNYPTILLLLSNRMDLAHRAKKLIHTTIYRYHLKRQIKLNAAKHRQIIQALMKSFPPM